MLLNTNLKKIAISALLTIAMMVSSCFPVNHVRLQQRYKRDYDRFQSVKRDEVSPNSRQSLEYAGQYLEDAKKANKRWDHARARVMLKLAEKHLDRIDSPPEIPPGLLKLYEEVETTTPEMEIPIGKY